MKKPRAPEIRDLLRNRLDGLTPAEILRNIPNISREDTIRRCLESMPDAYIDRWTKTDGGRGQYSAVWCVVVPPENCPHPAARG